MKKTKTKRTAKTKRMASASEEEFTEIFEKKVVDTILKNRLFTKKDRVLVACSGGKDSTALLYILKKRGYNVQAITVDAKIGNYTQKNLENLKRFCEENNVKLHEISFRKEFGSSLCHIRQILQSRGAKLRSCTICGVLRRYLLNKAAKRLRADYVATGHNLDDEAQAVMMNLLRNNLITGARVGPKTGTSTRRPHFVQRVKPLSMCSEKDVENYSKIREFPVNYMPCPCRHDAYRNKIRKMLDRIEKDMPRVKQNIIISFSKELAALRKRYSDGVQEYCIECGEPSRSDKCGTCTILSLLKPSEAKAQA
ncbi:TIGR00269 family protein [Candidatus Woesearchaeota archaeon]|nr:TIGR00269 family protein [Candidatus Woesearchaeota archaeon]